MMAVVMEAVVTVVAMEAVAMEAVVTVEVPVEASVSPHQTPRPPPLLTLTPGRRHMHPLSPSAAGMQLRKRHELHH